MLEAPTDEDRWQRAK